LRYLGLDGFRKGWVCAWIDEKGLHDFDYSKDVETLLQRISHQRAMIDIPIGLPDKGYRECDTQAAKELGSSVFKGARRGVWAFSTYSNANAHYWSNEGPGKGISLQLWCVRDKIKQVDDIMVPARQHVLCETHPELIFCKLSADVPLDKKKSENGRSQRITILKKMGFGRIEDMLKERRKTGIGRDDLIDACACALAARDAKQALGNSARDARGLLMQMHY
jgi:predicted RNase H-like nuclease